MSISYTWNNPFVLLVMVEFIVEYSCSKLEHKPPQETTSAWCSHHSLGKASTDIGNRVEHHHLPQTR